MSQELQAASFPSRLAFSNRARLMRWERVRTMAVCIMALGLVAGCTSTEMSRNEMPLHGEIERHSLEGKPDARASRTRIRETRSGTRFDRGADSDAERKTEHVARGDDASAGGDADSALYEYVRALVLDPADVSLYLKVASIHQDRGNTRLAATALEKALEVEPRSMPALEELGLLHLKARSYDDARKLLQLAIEQDRQRLAEQYKSASTPAPAVDPASPHRAHTAMGVLEDLAGNHDAAINHYQQALVFNPLSAQAANNIGYSHYLAGNLDQAEFNFARAIQLDPTLERAWYNRALLWVRQGHYNRAVNALASFKGDLASAHNTVGYICMLEGKHSQAEQLFAKAISLSPSYFAIAYQNRDRNRYLSNHQNSAVGQIN